MNFLNADRQIEVIQQSVEEIIPFEELKQKLDSSHKNNKPLVVKLGCDPSRPDLHIGHAVVLRKLRQFQDLGHQAVLVIGDFTAMIGDPSGRNKTRPQLTLEEAKSNAQSYMEQAKIILDIDSLKICNNAQWLNSMNFSDVVELASKYTVARMIERDDFEKRFRSKISITIHEFLYPLAQAMDSVHLKADIELGGTDQKFNLLVGRDIQREYGQDPQVILTVPLMEGTDGVEKMSKSYDNHIGITDSPDEMYGKTLSIPDNMIEKYFLLAANADKKKMDEVKKSLSDTQLNPRDIKRELARTIVKIYHSENLAKKAEENFDKIFIKKDIPEDIPEVKLVEDTLIVDVLVLYELVTSKSEARRLIDQGAVKINDRKCIDRDQIIKKDESLVIKVGKRRFLKII
ncbi:MAG: tyrosine--tRNA ligase [Candidatus Neomarinimicrobiota bacterium]|nr:tyrosine--tRNA ligase [Candidatus Neomarinimicrobiota bacterium]